MLNKLSFFKIKYFIFVFIASILIFDNIYASNIIYQPTKEDNADAIRQELNDIINGVVKPKAEEVYIFNDEVKPVKNPNFIEKKTMYQPSIAEEFGLLSEENKNNITKVDDYEFLYDGAAKKWTMHFINEDKISINPYSGMARGGFYKIGDKTYYFDDDGYMYTGILIDERDIVYNFNQDGILVFEGKLG